MGDCPLFPDDYQPRDPKASPLYRLLDAHYDEFRAVYEERFQKDYGYWRPVVDEVVAKFLECGDPHYGVTCIACEDCDESYFVPFSCSCRGFCPSCTQRKVLELAVLLEEDILRPTAHRHWIWTIPRMLRVHYRNHRKLLPKLCRCAWRALCEFIHAAYDRDDIFPGAMFVPQSFGNLGRWNAHAHALISDTCYDRQGNEPYHFTSTHFTFHIELQDCMKGWLTTPHEALSSGTIGIGCLLIKCAI